MYLFPILTRRSNRWLVLLGLVFLTAGCGVTGSSGDEEGFVSDDQALLRELRDGWEPPPEMFELSNVECVKLDDRVALTFTVTNLNDFNWAFGYNTVFTTSAGESFVDRNNEGFWEPGQAIELSTWIGKPEEYDDPPLCEVIVLHSSFLALRDLEIRAATYERLGWDPVNEERING